MQLCKIFISNHLQFKNFELDLTYPEGHPRSGEPLDKVCLIGRNGTGKSTLLSYIYQLLVSQNHGSNIWYKFKEGDKYYYAFKNFRGPNPQTLILHEQLEENPNWKTLLSGPSSTHPSYFPPELQKYRFKTHEAHKEIADKVELSSTKNDLVVFAPSEGSQNLYKQIQDVPQTTVNSALELFNNFPLAHYVSTDHINEFWRQLIYLLKKRDSEFRSFQTKPENLDKTVRQVLQEFDQNNPIILEKIGELWNKILERAGLEFDYKNASNPIQLNDNLKAYIKLKGTDTVIHYNRLSTGIRNFIFKVGHIYSLYFNRDIRSGFLLLDEPENSLFPDFLYDLVSTYFEITKNSQLLLATHSPIIAAQFEPCERIILDFDDQGKITQKRGVTPVGDDPNDILIKDFGIRSLLGKEGIEQWEKYIELKVSIKSESDPIKKMEMMKEFMEIGTKYNFAGNEVSK